MKKINRYRILKKLGEGGTALVYVARDRYSGKKVTLKILKDAGKSGCNFGNSFANEISILRKLNHPRIQKLIEYNDSFIVTEHISGVSLSEKLRKNGVFSEKDTVNIAIELIGILKYLHGLREPVIYRDLKPANIIISDKGKVYLIDFGAARLYRRGEKSDSSYLGTVGFAAPEQYGTLGQTDPKTDIYCFGMTLLQMATGIDIKNEMELEKFKLNGFPKLSSGFVNIINKCIKPGREDRFNSCSEIEKALFDSIVKKKRNKVAEYIKRGIAAAVLAAAISGTILYAEPVINYVSYDAKTRMPAFKRRLYIAKERITDYIGRELLKEEK